MSELPVITNETLASCSPAELINIMIEHEDRVPRNVIDECARRGEQMLDSLAPIAHPDDEKADEIPGYWWLRLHAVMILGLIPGEAAGRLLVIFIHSMNRDEDDNLQDWLSGYWPALMHNKPPSVIALLHDMCADKKVDWYIRANITEAVISCAHQQGGTALEETLDRAAQCIADEEEDWDYRLAIANDLLNYPRDRYRALITALSAQEHGFVAYFVEKDVNQAYARGTDVPMQDNFSNPWRFYERENIERRQCRWEKEDQPQEESDNEFDDFPGLSFDHHQYETYQRETPKVGRNEPCPCGSGKKYKKCCLG